MQWTRKYFVEYVDELMIDDFLGVDYRLGGAL